jgi:hypothetical protein
VPQLSQKTFKYKTISLAALEMKSILKTIKDLLYVEENVVVGTIEIIEFGSGRIEIKSHCQSDDKKVWLKESSVCLFK